MRRLARLYSHRIVNVNVNIIIAGLAAMGVTVAVMHVSDRLGWLDLATEWASRARFQIPGTDRIILGEKIVISAITFVVDLVADVGVYYALHWFANHLPGRKSPRTGAYAELSFMRDATLVQFERAILSPVLYIAALGLQIRLLHAGVGVGRATAVGFGVGILISRTLHTLWMIRAERRARRTTSEARAR